MHLRQDRWFFTVYLISGRVVDGLSTLMMKLPRMIVTLEVGGGNTDSGTEVFRTFGAA